MKKSKCLILLCMSALVLGGCNLTSGDSSSSSSASSSESSSTKEEGAQIYALIGDFKDANFDISPSEGSSYYLDSSVTTYWERTVVTSSSDESKDNARLAVVNYGTYDIVAGYSSLTSNSIGAFEDSGTNYIGLYWDSTYKVEIDFTNNNKSITITLVSGGPTEGGESGSSSESGESGSSSESGESGSSSSDNNPGGSDVYDSAYTIYGEFTGDNSWNSNPIETLEVYLPYNSNYPETKKWTRTLSTPAAPTSTEDWEEWGPWDPSFRITTTGSYEEITTVAGYSELDSNSTGVEDWGNEENNEIQLLYWEATYTITIDLTSDNGSILVVYDTSSGGTHYEDTGDDDDEQGEEEYDYYYSLVGNFDDAEWDGWPEKDSKYYLGYDPENKSTMKWERTVTMADSDAKMRVANVYWNGVEGEESDDVWELVCGYEQLDQASTGVMQTTDDDFNIILYAGQTYDLVIDCTGDTNSILVTLVDDGTTYTEGYVLYGDFEDSSWDASPLISSKYFLGYDPNNSETKYWTVDVTTPSSLGWNASFRVTPYGETTASMAVANFANLDTVNSEGVESSGNNDNNIVFSSLGTDYTITIDMRSDTASILVKYASSSGGDTGDSGNTGDTGSGSGNTGGDYQAPTDVTYDTYYVLYGGFSDSSWNVSPSKQANTGYALGFDSRYQESRYWTRTITTDSQGYGFRIVEYGNYESLVAGYSNFEIDSASSNYVSAGDINDNNIKFAANNTSYDITIDMRTANWTLSVSPHSSNFTTFDGYYDENPSAFLNNYSSLNVGDDYIMGADISSIAEVEAAGGKFYDYEGKEVDCISYLASQGINYARLRLWVDPTDGSGNSYQGGGNDINTDIAIAKRCVDAGMKICLDLHYSDFWTHRGQQFAPKSWTSYSGQTLYSAASSWTTTVLGQLETAGCPISMVQVGNETNNNAVCGTSGTDFFKECCTAVRTFSNENHASDDPIKIVIHYALDQDINTYKSYYNNLINASVDFDVIGLSYYPYYHLSKGSLDSVLSSLTTSYPTKDFAVMEYSTGWTLTYPWDNQGTYGTTANTFGTSQVSAGGYGASVSEQARCIYDINKSVASIGSQGLGTFYWEPAWLARSGTSWASSSAAGYYTSNNSSLSGADVTTWSNQALFDYRGYALDSLKIYNIMK